MADATMTEERLRDETAYIRAALARRVVSLKDLSRATAYDGKPPIAKSTVRAMLAGRHPALETIHRLQVGLQLILSKRPEDWAILEADIAAKKEAERRDRIEKERAHVLNTATQ